MDKITNKKLKLSLLILVSIIILTGCLPRDGSYTEEDPATFYQEYGMVGSPSIPTLIYRR